MDPRDDDPYWFWPRVGLWAAFAFWGVVLIRMDYRSGEIGASFLHRPLLIFHEAGHVVFRLFGEWMTIFGGTLEQCDGRSTVRRHALALTMPSPQRHHRAGKAAIDRDLQPVRGDAFRCRDAAPHPKPIAPPRGNSPPRFRWRISRAR